MNLAGLLDRSTDRTTARVVELDVAGKRREFTHAELTALARARAGQLTAAGVRPGHVIGIRAGNSVDWLAWDLAVLATGARLKAFADTVEIPDPGEFIARHRLALLIADASVPAGTPAVVRPDGAPAPGSVAAGAVVLEVDDVHSLVYSSGTSGQLKGLEISAKGTEYVINRFIESFGITGSDRHLIFLPLPNYQQRLSVYLCLWLGADLVLAPYQRVFQAVRKESPTFLIGPPVFYDTALQLYVKSGGDASLADFLGGRIRFMITGMAPIRRETLDGYWQREVPLLEAYGLTETGMVAWNTPDRHRVGTVGQLMDPESVTFLDDGEVIITRDAPLGRGYFDTDGDPSAADIFRPDGSILTGDYGRLDEEGFLTLIGRKKDVIALGSGRKVHPAEIEAAFAGVDGVSEIVVVPTPQSNRLGAIVTTSDPGDAPLRARVEKQIDEVNAALDAHERVMSLVFSATPLRSDPAFMTANMKLSRARAAEHFAERIAADTGPGTTGTTDSGTSGTSGAPGAADPGAGSR
ncbi:AMP-binding protein [Streptomyces sp. NPDC017940]|uniref:AMP-binding protein n=1 Tax=Streptomyces sp. NPDC017940 TaxID=3365017 RepID=UPI0037937290